MARFVRIVNGVPRSFDESGTPTIYDEVINVGSTITTGTSVTLPASGTYNSAELEVYLNGQRLAVTEDYTYVGSPARTQVQFTFDLLAGDKVRFRVDRGA